MKHDHSIIYQIIASLIAILLLLLTVACAVQRPALTPEDAAQRPFHSQPQGFQLLGKRSVSAGVIVIFEKNDPAKFGRIPYFGCHLTIKKGIGWDIDSSNIYNTPQPTLPKRLVRYSSGRRLSSPAPLLCGQILSPPVAAVEVALAGGQTVRDQTDDGLFAVMMPPQTTPCTLRLLDKAGYVLDEVDISEQPVCVGG